jgi:RNA polymerase sigma-70 factor (ECF subfamily)
LGGEDDSDDALVQRAGRGDRNAAARLIARHSPRILAVCTRMLGDRASAEDCAQETFLKLWRSAGGWRPGRAKFETWLYRVATNACIDRIRRRRPETAADDAAEYAIYADGSPLADEQLVEDQRRATIDEALRALPDRQRLAVVLCHYEEMSYAEAAAVMEVSVDAFESLLARARRSLKESLAPIRAELMCRGR